MRHIYGSQRSIFNVSPSLSIFGFETESLPEPIAHYFVRLAGQRGPGILLSLPPLGWDCKCALLVWEVLSASNSLHLYFTIHDYLTWVGIEDLNSGPHAGKEGTLLTELSP